MKLRSRLNEILAQHTGKTVDQVATDTERDFYMSAEESASYGIVDKVVSRRPVGADSSATGNSRTNGGGSKKGSIGASRGATKSTGKAAKKGDDDT